MGKKRVYISISIKSCNYCLSIFVKCFSNCLILKNSLRFLNISYQVTFLKNKYQLRLVKLLEP